MDNIDKNENTSSRNPLVRNNNDNSQNDMQYSQSPLTRKNDNASKDLSKPSTYKKKKHEKDSFMNSISNKNTGTPSTRKLKKNENNKDTFRRENTIITNPELETVEKEKSKSETVSKKKQEEKFIVDNIENIYANLDGHSLKYTLGQYLLFFVVFMVGVNNWLFIFLCRSKMERNYCYTSLNQLDVCSKQQICDDYGTKFDILLYDIQRIIQPYEKSYSSHDYFVKENKIINEKYKSFFLKYSYDLSNKKVFSKLQLNSIQNDKTNFAVILTNRERWNMFYKYFSLCESSNYYIILVIVICVGGSVGSMTMGYLADLYGRKIIIQISLFIASSGFLFLTLTCAFLDSKYGSFENQFDNAYQNDSYEGISLKLIYTQEQVRKEFKKIFIMIAGGQFLLNGMTWSLLKNSLALLIENCTSELNTLVKYRYLHFVYNGLPPFFVSLLLSTVNNYTGIMIIFTSIIIVLFLASLFLLDESMRYYYEYCEWEKLTELILKTFKKTNHLKIYNKAEFEAIIQEENKKIFTNNIKNLNKLKEYKENNDSINKENKNSYFNELKEKRNIIKRNIKRRTEFVIKLSEMQHNPILILTCLNSNRTFQNSRYLLIIVVMLLYLQLFLVEKEMAEGPFFTMKDLVIRIDKNIIINSNFLYMIIVLYISNYGYYALYRISCFKSVIVFSLIIVCICFISYHFCISGIDETPIDLNQYNFNMFDVYQRDKYPKSAIALLLITYFFLNGVIMYINLLMIKISRTIYRGVYCAIQNISVFIAFALSEAIHWQMTNYYLFLSGVCVLCLLTFAFLSEFKELPYLINDLKLHYTRDKNSNKNK